MVLLDHLDSRETRARLVPQALLDPTDPKAPLAIPATREFLGLRADRGPKEITGLMEPPDLQESQALQVRQDEEAHQAFLGRLGRLGFLDREGLLLPLLPLPLSSILFLELCRMRWREPI